MGTPIWTGCATGGACPGCCVALLPSTAIPAAAAPPTTAAIAIHFFLLPPLETDAEDFVAGASEMYCEQIEFLRGTHLSRQ